MWMIYWKTSVVASAYEVIDPERLRRSGVLRAGNHNYDAISHI